MTFKYRFEMIYQPPYFAQSSELMRKLDMDIGEIGVKECFTFTSKNDLSISKVKEHLMKCFKEENMTILHLEGGKIE